MSVRSSQDRTPQVMPKPADPLFSTPEAEAYIGVGRGTLEAWRCLGRKRQPAFLRVGSRMIRYRKSALDAFLAAGEVGDTAA